MSSRNTFECKFVDVSEGFISIHFLFPSNLSRWHETSTITTEQIIGYTSLADYPSTKHYHWIYDDIAMTTGRRRIEETHSSESIRLWGAQMGSRDPSAKFCDETYQNIVFGQHPIMALSDTPIVMYIYIYIMSTYPLVI